MPLLLTTVTATGAARVHQLFGTEVWHLYLPYDLPPAVGAFLNRIKPRLALIVETEIWPNLYLACQRRGIGMTLVNARLSERSLRGYRLLRPLFRAALQEVHVAAQSRTDAQRYQVLGARPQHISISGNLKFDMRVPADARPRGQQFRQQWGADRLVWIAASTHDGEEKMVLEAHLKVLQHEPDCLLLLAPRHPDRFTQVAGLTRRLGLSLAMRSEQGLPDRTHQVLLIDAMGELMPFYAASEVSFVGGSLVPIGGHNVLEPAALARPLLVGPHTFHFTDITSAMVAAGGAWQLADATELTASLLALLCDRPKRERMGKAGASGLC